MSSSSRPDPRPAPSVARRPAVWQGALAGLAVGGSRPWRVAELIAGLIKGAPSLVTAVGTMIIALQPAGAKELMVNLFGTNDKLALNLAVLVVALPGRRPDRRPGGPPLRERDVDLRRVRCPVGVRGVPGSA